MKTKITILLLVCTLLITGCSNENMSIDKEKVKENAIQKIGSLVLDQQFLEAEAVLDFAEQQISSKIEGMRGTIDSLKLAKEYYIKEDYTKALDYVYKADEVAEGDNMIKGVYALKEKITTAQNTPGKNVSNEENIGGMMSIPIDWNNVTASSYLPHKTKDYQAKSAIDKDSSTAWIENGVHEDGIGEYIELKNSKTVRIDKIDMTNGFAVNEKTYTRNNRIENAKIVFYNEQGDEVSTINHTFEDDNLDIVSIDVPGDVQANSIRIFIESVYTKDRKDKDTCISDLVVYGEVLN